MSVDPAVTSNHARASCALLGRVAVTVAMTGPVRELLDERFADVASFMRNVEG